MADPQVPAKLNELLVQLPDWTTVISTVDNWQTLITGMVAILAALIGARAINHQIRHAEELESERRVRHEDAVLATLPVYLESIHNYIHDTDIWLLEMRRRLISNSGEQKFKIMCRNPPEFPTNILAEIRISVEFSSAGMRNSIVQMTNRLHQHIQNLSKMKSRLIDYEDISHLVDYQYQYQLMRYVVNGSIVGASVRKCLTHKKDEIFSNNSDIIWDDVENYFKHPTKKNLISWAWPDNLEEIVQAFDLSFGSMREFRDEVRMSY